ncbi:MAG: molybdopterin-dependent oxidoreductase [Verrucomicrobia bacterium]|nr:molybdopterin-dependent oxidoreductase [Verrucomicrobiota bacterium]
MSETTSTPAAPTPVVAPPGLVNIQVDGKWVQVPKGTRVIEAVSKHGTYVPRYCYHPKLSAPGNCRMCLIEMGSPKMGPDRKPILDAAGYPEIAWMPRPQICCSTDVSEGMGYRSQSPLVDECRKGVMEFLLINHPLDCPICDQAGECRLQEFSVEFGRGESRFIEEKVKKPKKVELGPRITLDDERCIMCSRCIRFSKEIAHDDVLGFTQRGSHTVLTAYPGRKFDNNYSLNTVDICPVGALTSNDFRFKMRVWFLKETKSFCTSCGTGCNTTIGSRENVIYRQTPRENNDVNEVWMCDHGRLNFHYLQDAKRLTQPLLRLPDGRSEEVSMAEAVREAAAQLRHFKGEEIGLLASGRMTNEELFLAAKLKRILGIEHYDIVGRPQQPDDILVSDDGNPNTRGAQLFKLTGESPGRFAPVVASKVNDGVLKALICLGEDAASIGAKPEALQKLSSLIVLDLLPNASTAAATVVLPGAAFAEKRGSMINVKGRLQRLNQAIRLPGNAGDDWEILRDLIAALDGGNGIYTIEDLFQQMAAEHPQFAGLSLSKIGDLGVPLP